MGPRLLVVGVALVGVALGVGASFKMLYARAKSLLTKLASGGCQRDGVT